jgi:hypothetical protein
MRIPTFASSKPSEYKKNEFIILIYLISLIIKLSPLYVGIGFYVIILINENWNYDTFEYPPYEFVY